MKMKFMRKDAVIEAYQAERPMKFDTKQGIKAADAGDWIVTDANGETYPMTPDEFHKYYDNYLGG